MKLKNVIQNYNTIKKRFHRLETGEWRRDPVLCMTTLSQLELMYVVMKQLDDMGIGLVAKRYERIVN